MMALRAIEHQYNRRGHNHMVCTECGTSVEFFAPELEKLEQEIGKKYRYLNLHGAGFPDLRDCSDC